MFTIDLTNSFCSGEEEELVQFHERAVKFAEFIPAKRLSERREMLLEHFPELTDVPMKVYTVRDECACCS